MIVIRAGTSYGMYRLLFTKGEGKESDTDRKKTVRNAFNSPVRPFVLATTSIGQEGLDFHNSGRISYSEFLAAMVSSKNFNKEEKIKSVFNLLRESEQNKDYITYDSLENAAKALNLNINRERIKLCFDKLNGHLSLEKFQKLIMNENFEDESIEPTSNNFNKIKRNLTYPFKQKS